jgi:hypothetical protein
MSMPRREPGRPKESRPFRDQDVAEFGLLLPLAQAAALEGEAHRRGLSVGRMLRLLIEAFLRHRDQI